MRAAEEMAALAGDFPEFDAALLACMVEDQGGDVAGARPRCDADEPVLTYALIPCVWLRDCAL